MFNFVWGFITKIINVCVCEQWRLWRVGAQKLSKYLNAHVLLWENLVDAPDSNVYFLSIF